MKNLDTKKDGPQKQLSYNAPSPKIPEIPNKLQIEQGKKLRVVEFKNVTKMFGKKTILKNISFVVEDKENEGELVTIAGASGCGKSTLGKILAGISPHFPPTMGEAWCFGKKIEGPSIERGVVDQKYSLLPHLSVVNNISFGLKLQGIKRKERLNQAKEWVEKVGLQGNEDKFPYELSGGMQQRVAIASTLILKPKAILMDEPFGALDPKIRVAMQDLLIQLWKEQQETVFFITHSAEEAVYLGDRVYRMGANPGRILEEIPLRRPEKPLVEMRKVKEFQEAVNYLVLKLEEKEEPHADKAN